MILMKISEMTNLSLTDSNSDTDTCRSLNMLPRAKPPTPNYPYGQRDFDGKIMKLKKLISKHNFSNVNVLFNIRNE